MIYDAIGSGMFGGVSAKDFVTDLSKHSQTGKYHAFNPEGKDGLEVPIAISITFATTQQFDAEILVIKREAVLKKSGVVWPEKITDKQTQSATEYLDGLGLLIRE